MSKTDQKYGGERHMKRFILIAVCLFLICGTVFYYVSIPHNVSDITAEGGVLDLTGADFTNTLFTLDGEWEFYYGQFITPEDFRYGKSLDGTVIKTPGSWKNAGYSLTGFATYRLVILTDETDLTIQIPKITFSSTVWFNGGKVFESGKPGKTKEETEPGIRTAYVNITPENGRIEIVVQTANYNWFVAGLRNSFGLGRSAVVQKHAIIRYCLVAAVIGALLVLALYHFILFLYSRNESVYLAFALSCLTSSTRFILETNSFAQLFLPDGMGEGLTILYLMMMIFHATALIFFIHTAFAIPIKNKAWLVLYGLCFVIPMIFFFIVPSGTCYVNSYLYLVIIPMICSAVSAARSKRLREDFYYALFFFSMVVFILWYPIQKVGLDDALFMPGVATHLFLALCQCVMLSAGYAKGKRREEELSTKTELLNRLNRTKTEFLQDMSHEMKAPLTVIATGIDYADRQIKKESGDLSEAGSALETVRDETQRLGRMVSGMVDLASMNEISDNRNRVNFALLLQNSAEAFRLALEHQNNNLTVEIASGLPDVFVENDRFVQVMANLFYNAADYTQDGQITLTAEYDSVFITVRMTDTGCGIEPEILSRVFERGVSGRDGTGYGLYICKTVVEAHGGTIKIESAADKGTVVTFTVPVYGGQEAGHE